MGDPAADTARRASMVTSSLGDTLLRYGDKDDDDDDNIINHTDDSCRVACVRLSVCFSAQCLKNQCS